MFGTIDIFCNGNPRVASNKRETITIKLTEFKAAAIKSLNEKKKLNLDRLLIRIAQQLGLPNVIC